MIQLIVNKNVMFESDDICLISNMKRYLQQFHKDIEMKEK